MCLITFQWQPDSEQKLVLSANRDEFLHRPALELHAWENIKGVFAGKDITHGGTWLGVHHSMSNGAVKQGRIAFLTNHRDMSQAARERAPKNPISRGSLVLDFLTSDLSALDYLKQLEPSSLQYEGYNLIVAEGNNLGYFSNCSGKPAILLEAGLYGLSNALLDTPWPKLTCAKHKLNQWVHSDSEKRTQLAGLLSSTAMAPDEQLPETGIGIKMERILSSEKIITPNYGTCCSTGLIWRDSNIMSECRIEISEVSWNADGSERSRSQHDIHATE